MLCTGLGEGLEKAGLLGEGLEKLEQVWLAGQTFRHCHVRV
jgi:hypothetical protein